MRMRTWRILGTCVALLGGIVSAQEAAEADGFKTTVAAGLNLTDGNSKTMQANASLLTEGERDDLGSVRFGVEGNYGESTVRTRTTTDGKTVVTEEDNTTLENARAFAGARKTLSETTYTYIEGSALYDDIAKIDYRVLVGPGLGIYLLKNDTTKFSVEAGVSYVWEEVEDVRDDYFAPRVAERFEHRLSATARVWQSAELLVRIDDFDDQLLHAEIGVEAALNAHLNLRVVLQDTYDSTPGADLERNDIALIAGIGFKF